MKLRVPALLLSALLAAMTVTQAHANYVVNTGTFYDTGKEYASTMPKPTPGEEGTPGYSHHDDYYCWALAASNITQYWQDTYKDKVQHADSLPDGISEDKGVLPYGTSYLAIYEDFLKQTPNTEAADIGALQEQFIQWYFKGKGITSFGTTIIPNDSGTGAYYGGAYDGIDAYNKIQQIQTPNGLSWDDFESTIKEAFKKAGTAVGLDVRRDNPGGDQNKQHAMACWGYETDSEGNITSLIMSDSDDRYFGTFRLEVKNVNGHVAVLTDNHIVKENNDNEVYFLGRDYQEAKNYVYALTTIVTPVQEAQVTPASELTDQTVQIMENSRITSDLTYNGTGLKVGDGQTVLVLTSNEGKTLTINGNEEGNPGLDITPGTMVSVDSLEVKNCDNGGVVADGHLHIGSSSATDSAVLTNNTTNGDGGAIKNDSFVDISNCNEVTFTNNHADSGKGGAIYSRPTDDNIETYDNTTVSIRGNGAVVFSGNTAQEGNDIYIGKGSSLNIADNDSVLFVGSDVKDAAIVSKGEVYLSCLAEKTIDFNHCSLDSSEGTVFIGRDINISGGKDGRGWGYVNFKGDDGQQLAISFPDSNVWPAVLENVTIDATGVYGVDVTKSLISNMYTDGESTDYLLQNLTIDTSSTLGAWGASNTITLNNVNITLRENDQIADNTFDITKLFQTTTNFEGAITFDASGFKPEELPTEMQVKLSQDVTDAIGEQAKLTLIMGGYEYEFLRVQDNSTMVFGNAQPVVPEPTSGTLSLLALAGLCARRRRK